MRRLALFVLCVVVAVAHFGAGSPGVQAPYLHQAAMEPTPEAIAAAQSATLAPEELAARVKDGRWILLRSAVFDPVNEGPPAFAQAESLSGVPNRYVLVQFTEDLRAADWRAFERQGVKLLAYVPSHAYVARVEDETALAAIMSHPLYRWSGPYAGGYKVSPMLSASGWKQGVFVDARLFPGENPVIVGERLQALEPAVAVADVQGSMEEGARVRLFIPEGGLHPFIEKAADDPAIESLDPWFLPHVMNNNSIWVVQNYDTTNKTNYALSATMWNHAITGTGQTPGISDTGCDDDMCYFRYSSAASAITDAQSPTPPTAGTLDATKKVLVYTVIPGATSYDGNTTCSASGSPESWHGTHTSCTIVGDNYATLSTPTSGGHDAGDGMAPNAKLIFQDAGSETSGCLDGLSFDNYLIFQQAYNEGARIHSNSWGGDTAGVYTSDCQTVDRFIYDHEDFQFFFANGNAGSGAMTVGSPATAKDCISVGATDNGSTGANTMASFSSRGPTADGRRKPDVCTPGETIVSALGDSSHTSNNCSTQTMDGTSMATPTAAGAGTLMRQYFSDGFYPTGAAVAANAMRPSAALLKAAMINGAVDMSYTTQATMLNGLTPDNNQGFGRVCLDTAAFFSTPSRDARRLRVWDKWNAAGLTTGQQDAFSLQVTAGQPLKVTLVWTDPQCSTVAAVNLVNNLDLEVVAPDGSTTYKGNVFSGGQSATGGSADALNNVEEVFLTAPTAGTWTLRVKATAVPGTPLQVYSTRQGYALAATYADCTNALVAPATLTATNNATTGIDLSWGSVSGATGYQIYRASGNCSVAATEFHYLAKAAGTTFTDTLVQGGYAYAYKVRAVDNCNEGPYSPCATATYTGNCTLYPTFGGLTSAVNDTATTPCDALLGWSAGTSNCPQGSGIKYNIYRGTTPYFTIGAGSRVATGQTGTSYRDNAVVPNTTYYYVVRAEDGTTANGGPANGGNQDLNTVMMSATPTASTSTWGTWSDAGGDSSKAYLLLDFPWRVTNQQNHTTSGTYCYHAGPDGSTYPNMTCASATTPVIPLQAGQSPVLTFWERFNLEYQWDGVTVEVSDNGGAFTQLAIVPDYPQTFSQTGSPPVNACAYAAAVKCFSGPSGNAALTAWTSHTAALSAYAGHNVQIRWRLSSDPASEYDGFYLDDISITYAGVPNDCSISDGIVSLDKAVYRCSGGTVSIQVIDSDLIGTGTLIVTAASTWETTPENVTLTETPAASGKFVGSITTAASAPVHGDGLLSIRDGDTITVTYVDANDGHGGTNVVKTATAAADCVAPIISNVQITNIGTTSATVTWTTNEAANSRATYGTGTPPGTNQDDLANYVTSHSVNLTGLTMCTKYYVSVTSADGPGNAATDNNAGAYYTFTTSGMNYAMGPDNVEGGVLSWVATGTAGALWHQDTCKAHSGTHAWKAGAAQGTCPGTYVVSADTYLTWSANITLGSAGHGYHLYFWENYTTESGYDYCHPQVSTDGGTTWADLASYAGTGAWAQKDYDLAAYTGATVRIRFWFHSDTTQNYEGWYVDDIEISKSQSCTAEMTYQSNTFTDACSGTGTGVGNGYVDPGEDITLHPTLKNTGGQGATGLSATLSTSTPGITVTGATTTYPDLASGASAACNAPHFTFSVGTGVACGTVINFNLHITAATGGGPWDQAFTVTVGHVVPGGNITDFSQDFTSVTPPALPAGWTESHTSGNAWVTTASYYCGAANGLYYPYNASQAANSYAYTPGIALTTGVTYTLNFNQKVQSATFPENFEVKCGTAATPAGQTITILASAQYTNTTCTLRSPTFTVPSTGTYYISWHCTSAADEYYLIVDDVTLTHPSVPSCTIQSCTPAGCTAPGAPTLTGATGTCSGVTLNWTAGTGTTNSYNAYRSTNTSCPVGTLTKLNASPIPSGTLTYNDTTAVAGTTYTYVVRGACDAGGLTESANSNCLAGTRLAVPAAPAAPTFTGVGQTSITVNWSAAGGATTYDVWRQAGASCTGASKITASPVAGLSYADNTVTCANTYSYFVTANNTCGTSANGACNTQATSACASAPKPVPDGRLGGTAMTGTRVTVDGSSISCTYDTGTCSVPDHSIIYGTLANVSTVTPSGSVCSIANTSPYSWTSVPAGNLWWVIVGDSGTTESSWGQKYVGGTYSERSTSPSNQCGNTVIDTSGTCP